MFKKLPFTLKVKQVFVLAFLLFSTYFSNAQAPYCGPTYTSACSSGDFINNFSTTGGATNITNNNTGCNGNANNYIFYSTLTCSQVQGLNINLSMQSGSLWGQGFRVWIDWNGNNSFADPGESVYASPGSGTGVYTTTITVPLTALAGIRRMRVQCQYFTVPLATDYCATNISFGETEDYNFDVIASGPCSGTPNGGIATGSATPICIGSTSTVSVTGVSVGSGITYQWQFFDGSTWQNTVGGTGANNVTYTTPSLMASTQYRCAVTCSNSNITSYSSPFTINVASSSLPYIQTFESITAVNTLPSCMAATGLGGLVTSYLAATTYNRINRTPGGSKFASFRWGSNDWIYTPALYLTAGSQYQFSYWYITDGFSGWTNVKAAVGSAQTLAAMTTIIGTIANPTNTSYQQYTGTFTPSTSGYYFFGINCVATNSPFYLTIDDIGVDLVVAPGAPTTSNNTPICAGNSFTLTASNATNSPNAIITWTGPNSFTATGSSITITNATTAQSGTYFAKANQFGLSSVTVPTTVVVNTTPAMVLGTVSQPSTCNSGNGSIQLNGLQANTNYFLDYTLNGNAINTQAITTNGSGSYIISGLNPGVYSAINIKTPALCPSNTINNVTLTAVSIPPIPTINMTSTTVCSNLPINLSATSSINGATYTWSGPNSFSAIGQNPVINSATANAAGTYSVYLTTPGGCNSAAATITINVVPSPNLQLAPANNTNFCPGGSCALTVSFNQNYTYLWKRNGIAIPGAITSTYLSSVSGTYTVDGTVNGTCPSTSNAVTTNLLIQPNPIITAFGNTLTTGIYNSYQWYRYGAAINGATQQTYTAMQDGSYTVRVENAAGCFGVSEVPVVINTLGLSSLSKNGIQVYPNPTERLIEISGNQLMELTIKDLSGKIIVSKDRTTKLDLSNIAAGIYLLEVRNENHELVGVEKITKH
jgi:hypothetical protein